MKQELYKKEIKTLTDDVRVVMCIAGALNYAAFERLQGQIRKIKELFPKQPVPDVLDMKKDLEKILKTATKIHDRIKLRFLKDSSKENFENLVFGIYQCIYMLSLKSENEIYEEAIRLSGMKTNFASIGEQMRFLDSVLDKSRQSNHDAIRLIQERREILEKLNAEPLLIEDSGTVKVYDIAPEREEVA